MTDDIVEFRKTFADWMETLCEHLGTITKVLVDINTTLASHKIIKTSAPKESTVSGGARYSVSLEEALGDHIERVLIKDSGNKVYTSHYLPDEGETKGQWKAINTVLKEYGFKWESLGKDSHWRKK